MSHLSDLSSVLVKRSELASSPIPRGRPCGVLYLLGLDSGCLKILGQLSQDLGCIPDKPMLR